MGILKVAMLAMIGHMVVLGMAIGTRMVPNLVICNTLFMKQEAKLVTYSYVAGLMSRKITWRVMSHEA